MDGDGNMYVSDDRRLQKFDMEGKFVRDIGKGVLRSPNSVAIDGHGSVFVVDLSKKAVVVFDRVGEFVGEFGEGELSGPVDIVVDGEGCVYVSGIQTHQIDKFNNKSMWMK